MSKVVVYHAFYGCDTGCCGHVIQMDGKEKSFSFDHCCEEDKLKWAQDLIREELGEEHVADLDWENSFVTDD
ncbi:hypothetical protein [Jiangella anatolica]|uniref:Uncharacterized protein n=1 Tax=Jiangella anatolica TaxID=2670374 RepID=A0A2W2BTA5_9ACTN|nr:hypothetical protein [Jiangella anatolica]PZF83218.1 hypothetical protein C1I92_13150 [Jiangella anatolica]